MAHKEQIDFIKRMKLKYPGAFYEKKVLDVGSFDVNGSTKEYFKKCDFIGIDLAKGPGVDIAVPAQEYDAPDETYDTIISCECLEHNQYWEATLQNIIRMLKQGGVFIMACATTGRAEHGTTKSDSTHKERNEKHWITMPNVFVEDWNNDYYKNLTEQDIRSVIDITREFYEYSFELNAKHHDLYFSGRKRINGLY